MVERSFHPSRCRRILRLVGAAVLVAAVGPPDGSAQPPEPQPDAEAESAQPTAPGAVPAPPSDVEVIRIKGRAVTGIETEVPASVTQFSSEDLQALGAQNVSDLAKVTPNVEIKTTGSTAPTFFIRGVGLSDFSANAAGAVAIYRDDVAINGPAIQLTPLFDLENVEVLRGPQGTGSGRNASAGAIKVYSRRPTGDLTSELKTSLGNYNFKDFEGAIEAPLVDEMLGTRLAFRWTERDGIAKNRCGNKVDAPGLSVCGEGAPLIAPGMPVRVNDVGNWSARGLLRFQPPEVDMDWILNLHGTKIDQLSTLGQAMGTGTGNTLKYLGSATASGYVEPDNQRELTALGGNTNKLSFNLARRLDQEPFEGDYDVVGDTKLETWGAGLRGDWTLGWATLTSVTGYETYDRTRVTDQDFTPNVLFESASEDTAWQVFQELKLSGELPERPVRWELGAYLLKEDLTFNDEQAVLVARFSREYTQDLMSYAVYASFGWDFLDDFTLEGGARWNYDRKDFSFTQDTFLPGSSFGISSASAQVLTGTAPTGTLTLNYRFTDEVSSYWKYSHGWKPGTFNSIATLCNVVDQTCGLTTAEPEMIDAWEAGLRGTWLDGRLQAGAALFYYMYNNYQVFVVADAEGSPPAFQIVNASDAEVYGAELDLRLEPLADLVPPEYEGLVLSARGGWLESQFLDFTTSQTQEIRGKSTDVQQDFSGNPLINSPRFKLSASAEWTLDLGRWGALIPRYDFSWTSDVFFDPNEGRGAPDENGDSFLPKYAVGQEAYWLHNVRLGYRVPEGNIEIAGWARNVTDKVYKTYGFDASTFANVLINFVGEPRTYGMDLTIRF
jgi:iron complex outermembrane receptor protein